MAGVTVALGDRELRLPDLEVPLRLDALVPGPGPWEVEIGFGKGRYLLRRAAEERGVRFLGIEVAGEYFRRVRSRMAKRGLRNMLLLRGEALYLLSAILPSAFASAVHVYFPDPWPKARHHERRLFDTGTVDLVMGLLEAGGVLYVATDFLEYGETILEIFEELPGAALHHVEGPWDGAPRTNYEAKYLREGRPIRRFEVVREDDPGSTEPHPRASRRLRVAIRDVRVATRSDDPTAADEGATQ
jgi:tRNA (guanine-N7-)-methyltransferase